MLIFFSSKKLAKCCNQQKVAEKNYGQRNAQKLMQRLSELHAANNLFEISKLPPPRCHELTGQQKGTFSVDLEHPYRLLFCPAHNPIPRLPDHGIDLKSVTEIEITSIEDTHRS